MCAYYFQRPDCSNGYGYGWSSSSDSDEGNEEFGFPFFVPPFAARCHQPRQCDSCSKIMGGPHLDIFRQLFKELAEHMKNQSQQRYRSAQNGSGDNGIRRFVILHPVQGASSRASAATRGNGAAQQQQRNQQKKLVIYNDGTDPIISIEEPPGTEIPPQFICPITMEIMKEPVVVSDGHSYERQAIMNWVDQSAGEVRSPLTNLPLDPLVGFVNTNLAEAIELWVETYGGKVHRVTTSGV